MFINRFANKKLQLIIDKFLEGIFAVFVTMEKPHRD